MESTSITSSINWDALGAIFAAVFIVLFAVASVAMAFAYKKISFAEIAQRYGVLLVCGVVATLVLVGGGVAVTTLLESAANEVSNVGNIGGSQQDNNVRDAPGGR